MKVPVLVLGPVLLVALATHLVVTANPQAVDNHHSNNNIVNSHFASESDDGTTAMHPVKSSWDMRPSHEGQYEDDIMHVAAIENGETVVQLEPIQDVEQDQGYKGLDGGNELEIAGDPEEKDAGVDIGADGDEDEDMDDDEDEYEDGDEDEDEDEDEDGDHYEDGDDYEDEDDYEDDDEDVGAESIGADEDEGHDPEILKELASQQPEQGGKVTDVHSVDVITAPNPNATYKQQKRAQIPGGGEIPAEISIDSENANLLVVDPKLKALATAEPGGACIDSFVNFALRFRERCSITCLRTMVRVLSSPSVLGLLSCFGCTNFIVQGFYALGLDCNGLFVDPNQYIRRESLESKSRGKGSRGKSGKHKSEGMSVAEPDFETMTLGDFQEDVNPVDVDLHPLNFGDMMKGLHNVDMNELQDWFDIGDSLFHVMDVNGQNMTNLDASERLEVDQERNEVDRDLFNKFVTKAAGFANWTLTPDMVEGTGVFDRLHDMNVL